MKLIKRKEMRLTRKKKKKKKKCDGSKIINSCYRKKNQKISTTSVSDPYVCVGQRWWVAFLWYIIVDAYPLGNRIASHGSFHLALYTYAAAGR